MANLSNSKRSLATTTALGALISLGLLVSAPASAKQAGVAAAVNTDATSIPPAEAERTLIVGKRVVFNERIKTSLNGQAQLLMLDQSAVTVGPNSELVIDKFVYDPDKRSGEMALSLSKGLMRFVGGRISKSGGVKVRTPVATMGIRGGIALINVVSPTSVDVTLLYGDEITGTTTGGQSFEVRRQGFFTRIEDGKPPTTPAPADPAVVQQKMNKLEGRDTANAGAEEKPTEEDSNIQTVGAPAQEDKAPPIVKKPADRIFVEEPIPDDLEDDVDKVKIEDEEEEIVEEEEEVVILPNVFQQLANFNAAGGADGSANGFTLGSAGSASNIATEGAPTLTGGSFLVVNPNEGDEASDDLNLPVQDDVSSTSAGTDTETQFGISADDFNDGQIVFIVNAPATNKTLVANFVDSQPLNFSLNNDGAIDAVPNVLNANDTRTYQSAGTFNGSVGGDLGNAIQADNIATGEFFDIDFTTSDFDGVSGQRFTLFGGVATTTAPTGKVAYDVQGDSITSSFLPYSEIGQVELPILGVQADNTREIKAENVAQTPFIVDFDRKNALYLGAVFQNVDRDEETSPNTERAYGIQAVVGKVANNGAIVLDGANAGYTRYELVGDNVEGGGAQVVSQYHAGQSTGAFVGQNADGVFMDGGHATIEAKDNNGDRPEPKLVTNHHLFQRGAPQAIQDAGTGVTTESLFGGTIIVNADGALERLTTDATAPGVLQIDRTNGTMIATLAAQDALGQDIVFQNEARNSAFINDKLFGIAEARQNADPANDGLLNGSQVSFVMVSGDAVTPTTSGPQCACNFMHWGYWAAAKLEPGDVSNSITDVGVFFAGVQTPSVDMPISGTATYNGIAAASLTPDGVASPSFERGDFSYTTNYATGIGQGEMNLGAHDFNIIGAHTPGQSGLNVDYFNPATTNQVGNGTGAYFGAGAANLGVTININDVETGLSAGGAAVAEK